MTHISLFPAPVVEIVAMTLFHFLWEGAVVAATLAMVLHAERRRSSNSRMVFICR